MPVDVPIYSYRLKGANIDAAHSREMAHNKGCLQYPKVYRSQKTIVLTVAKYQTHYDTIEKLTNDKNSNSAKKEKAHNKGC